MPPARPWHCEKAFMVLITKKCLELRGGMQGPSCQCSAHRGVTRGELGLSRAGKKLGIPGDMAVARVLSSEPQGHQGCPPHPATPATRPGRAACAMSPWQDVTVPSVARRMSPVLPGDCPQLPSTVCFPLFSLLITRRGEEGEARRPHDVTVAEETRSRPFPWIY